MTPAPYKSSVDWLRPAEEQQGLKRYVETVRERWRLIVAAVLVTTLIAILYVLTATKSYDATADMLITPVNSSDPVLTSLGLLRESSDPTRDVQTASQLIANIDVARRTASKLNSGKSPEELLEAVSAEPVANSNIVAVTAKASSPKEAQEIANAFAAAAVEERTATMHEEIAERLPRLEAVAASNGEAEVVEAGATTVQSQIAELKALGAGPDPTMRVQTKAAEPSAPSSPKKTLSIVAGIIAGLIIGIGGAFALQVLDPRLRRESQLRRTYRLPILARIPRARSRTDRPLAPGQGSPFVDEAYRTLRATLSGPRRSGTEEEGRLILVTGSSPTEGKTTTAVNLAASLALLGRRVILIEADLRRPVLGRFFGLDPSEGVVTALIDRASLGECLVGTKDYGPNLKLLLAEPDFRADWVTDLFSTPRAEALIKEAREKADYVIVDSPPLNEVADGLPLATTADDVLITTRLGRTRLDKLSELAELLDENGIVPSGFVLIGVNRPADGDDHYARPGGSPGPRQGKGGKRLPAGSRRPADESITTKG
ncbi:MAG: formate--tetrahydrofolate ligase [Actinobacteria bacterium]|nr:formate--tetrahydrofolate ligase [Actinomycetota bacterium]